MSRLIDGELIVRANNETPRVDIIIIYGEDWLFRVGTLRVVE